MTLRGKVPYQRIGTKRVLGWSVWDCPLAKPHDPHTWDSDHYEFGPFACPGNENPWASNPFSDEVTPLADWDRLLRLDP